MTKSALAAYLAETATEELGLDAEEAINELVKAIIIVARGDSKLLEDAGNQLAEG